MSFKIDDKVQIYGDEIIYGTVIKISECFISISVVNKKYVEEFNKNCGLYKDIRYHHEICWNSPSNKVIRRKHGSSKVYKCNVNRTVSMRKQIENE
jgi:hypothetical protein